MLVATAPLSVAEFTREVDERLDTPPTNDATKDASADYETVSPELDAQSPELTTKPPELSEEDKAERLWWDKVQVLGKIKDCSRMKQEVEDEIDDLLIQIKLKKEILKGQQALLGLYSSQLADIMDGHPLPKNPNAPVEAANAGESGASGEPEATGNWRTMSTRDLLSGIKGLGAKKLDAICDLAPTVGALETLRGDASKAHMLFKEVLPKGCGEAIADEIENRLCEKVRYDDDEAAEAESDDEPATSVGDSE